jgi:hypothetical protein
MKSGGVKSGDLCSQSRLNGTMTDTPENKKFCPTLQHYYESKPTTATKSGSMVGKP